MFSVSGRYNADASALFYGKYVLAWPRAVVGSNPSVLNAVTGTGRRVNSLLLGGAGSASPSTSLATVADVSISPDGALLAAVGANSAGQPLLLAGDGSSAVLKTSHALTKVLALDARHIVVADANDVAHLFVLSTEDGSLTASHTLTIEAVVYWTAVPMPSSTVLFAIVRNSQIMALRLEERSDVTQTAALKRCGAKMLIPTPQRLAVVLNTQNTSRTAAPSSSPPRTEGTLWVASGRECCAADIAFDGTTMQISMKGEDGQGRAAVPSGASTRAVLSLDAASSSSAYMLIRPAEKEDNSAENDDCAANAIAVNEGAVEGLTFNFPSVSAASVGSSSSATEAAADTVLAVSVKQLESTTGQPIIAGGALLASSSSFVGIVANVRQRSLAMLPLVPASSSPSSTAGSSSMASPLLAPKDLQRRMERAKATMSSLIHTIPTTHEESQRLIEAILKVQDEARALQRVVEGVVAESAPRALLQQLYVTFIRATIRNLFLRTNTSMATPMLLAEQQKAYVDGLSCLREVVIESFRGLPGGNDQQLEKRRWGPTASIFSLLLSNMGVDVDGAAYKEGTLGGAGDIIIKQCGEQLTADGAVAALYVVIAQRAVSMEELAPIATTLLRSCGLSTSLLHWALLLYLADNEPSVDISAEHPHLLCLDRSYDFGVAVMPRVIDGFACAGNVEAVYLMMPSMLQTAQFALDDRIAIRFLLAALVKGNAGLIANLVALARSRQAPWRAVSLHVAAVACAAMGQSALLEGAATAPEEETIVEAALRAVGTRTAHRIFIEFLVMQKHYHEALAMCESFPTGSDAEHQSVTALAATLRCLVPTPINSANRPYAFTGFYTPDTEEVMANASTMSAAVAGLRVPNAVIDGVAANIASATAAVAFAARK